MNYQKIKSAVGDLYIVADNEALRAVIFAKNWSAMRKQFANAKERENIILRRTKTQLAQYFNGKRRAFDIPLRLDGTKFQNGAWSVLGRIPFGETRSYKDQAQLLRSPKAVRAVGRANGLNPICIILPCHRVIGSNGSLTGYGGGLAAKKLLLQLEGARFRNL